MFGIIPSTELTINPRKAAYTDMIQKYGLSSIIFICNCVITLAPYSTQRGGCVPDRVALCYVINMFDLERAVNSGHLCNQHFLTITSAPPKVDPGCSGHILDNELK